MALQEQMTHSEDRQAHEVLVRTPEERGQGMAEHWRNFNEGREAGFYAYFMIDNDTHVQDRMHFLREIQASEEIPYPDNTSQAVLKTGRAILWAVSQAYPDGDPFAITYTGERVYPAE